MSYSVDHFWLSNLTAFNQIEGTEDEGFPFLPLEQNLGPYLNYDFPNPTLPARHPRGLCEFTGSLLLLTLFVAPVLQGPGAQAFTLPTVARPAAQQPQLLPAPLGLLTTTGTKPFLQADWPNPVRALPPALTWLHQRPTGLILLARSPQSTRIQFAATQQPNQAINRLPLGGAPFEQTHWPNPRGPVFPIDLLTWIGPPPPSDAVPFEPVDWPNPSGPVFPIGLRTWTSSLPMPFDGGEKPFLQSEWPNPVLRVPSALTWVSPAATTFPTFIRRPAAFTRTVANPAARQIDQINNLLPLGATAQAPFFNLDFPNPVRLGQPALTWISTLPPPFDGGAKPFLQSAWPNPVLATPAALTWINEITASVDAPFSQASWPNPVRALPAALSWTSTLPLPFDGGAKPFLQGSWPNPVRALPAALTWTSTLPPPFDGGAKPFLQSDWPNPLGAYTWRAIEPSQSFLANAFQILPPGKAALPDRAAAPRVVSADVQNVLGLLTQPAPFVAPNLPNPRGYEFPIALRTWVALPVPVPPTQPPFLNFDQPNPRGARPVPLSYTLGAPLPFDGGAKPIGQAGAEPPVVRAAAAPRTDPPNLLTTTLAAANPFKQAQWPNPTAVTPASQRLHVGAPLPFDGGGKPFLQVAWPNPVRALPAALSWTNTLPTPFDGGAKPFLQSVWPNPVLRLPAALTWVNTFPPPFDGGVKPFLQSDWSNPRAPVPRALGLDVLNVLALLSPDKPFTAPLLPNPRGAEFPVALRSWSAQIPPAPPTQTPFLNYDFPNPRGAKPIPLTFAVGAPLPFEGGEKPVGLAAVTLPTRAAVAPPLTDPPNLLGTTLGAVFKPFAQTNWPNPVLARVVPRETAQENLMAAPGLRPGPFQTPFQPNPRGPEFPIVLRTWVDSGLPPFQSGFKPALQADWPVPPGPRSGDTKFTLRTPLTLVTAPVFDPFRQTEHPNPLPKLWTIYGTIDRFPLTLNIAPGTPFAQTQWPNPVRRLPEALSARSRQVIIGTPFVQTDWPNPVLRVPPALTWLNTRPVPFAGGDKPFLQTAWPNPVLALKASPTWTNTRPIPFNTGAKPFTQIDWPNPRLAVPAALTFTQPAPLPFDGGEKPILQADWPVPKGYIHPSTLRGWANFVIQTGITALPARGPAHILTPAQRTYVQEFQSAAFTQTTSRPEYVNVGPSVIFAMTDEDAAGGIRLFDFPTRG